MILHLDVAAERTTAVTDVLLAVALVAGIVYIRRATPASPLRSLWLAAIALFAFGSLAGGALHATRIDDPSVNALWRPVYLVIGASFALIGVGAVGAWRGFPAARRVLRFVPALTAAYYVATWRVADDALVLGVFAAPALVFAFVVFGALGLQRRRGAATVALGLGFVVAAAAVQAAAPAVVRLTWTLDHNGLSHLIMLPGVAILVRGLRTALRARAAEVV
jgi:hypothetical protein